ncbi:hypothetical protein BV898_18295 [Hypsibius exemplaris]|uniref:ZP domain-containing protein n=1 Tax=Hypsibius exemplaris TaxID=2072580 RepID=A0A9X6NNW5_HYPEX|nr:hypothetical protein BV898_18295 [Hypsibius exemplaris]
MTSQRSFGGKLWLTFVCAIFCQSGTWISAQNVSTVLLSTSDPVTTSSVQSLIAVTTSPSSSSTSAPDLSIAENDSRLYPDSKTNQTCNGLFAFERTIDSAVQPAMVLKDFNRTQATLVNTTEVASTFPCNNLCQRDDRCVAYISDYNSGHCMLLYKRPMESRSDIVPLAGLAYYEKICLKIPLDMKCKKEWAFERVVGMELANTESSVLHGVRNRAECMSACLTETTFVCRSAKYNYQTNDCYLSKQSRRTVPMAFRATTDQVDYLENQCAPEPQICEYRAVEDRLFSVEAEVANVANITDCLHLCRNSEAFVCRAYRFDEALKQCLLSADDRASVRNAADQGQTQLVGFMERAECIDITMSCGPTSMAAVLKLNRPFNGRFYPADKPSQCVIIGNNDFEVQLTMALDSEECGTKSLGNGTFINDVVVQMHPIVLRDSDRRVRIACDYPTAKVTLTDELTVNGVPSRSMDPNQANITQTVSGIAALPKVRLQIRNGSGKEVQGAQLGDSLILSIDMVEEQSAFGIAASDLVAMSGSGVETLQLLDGRGCPVEPSIFPTLSRIRDGRSLTTRFAAFKFASDSIVKFRVTVSFCLDSCPLPDCSMPANSLSRKRRAVSGGSNSSALEERELTMELAILVDTESNKAPTIGKDGIVNEAQAKYRTNEVCTKSALIWGLGISAMIIQVVTLSCCIGSVSMYRQLKRQKGDIFESPSATTQTTLAWNANASPKNPDLFRMYK